MIKLLTTLLFLVTALAQADCVFYEENFEGGVKPSYWSDWSQASPATWDYAQSPLDGNVSILFAPLGDVNYGVGAFYDFHQGAAGVNDLYVYFKFKNVGGYPTFPVTEIIDLYDEVFGFHGDEIGDVYLLTNGQLEITAGRGSAKTSPMPTDTIVNIWVHYKNNYPAGNYMSVAWSLDTTEPASGTQFVSVNDGIYPNSPEWLLFGPTSTSFLEYDDLVLSRSPICPCGINFKGVTKRNENAGR